MIPEIPQPVAGPIPATILLSLRAALARADRTLLVELCKCHRESISANFSGWAAPSTGDTGPDDREVRVGDLYSVAKVFSNDLADPSLLRLLQIHAPDTFLDRWEFQLLRADRLKDPDEAITILTELLEEGRKWSGHGHQHLVATTAWYLSILRWKKQQPAEAILWGEISLAISRRIANGPVYEARYLNHLFRLHEYYLHKEQAARYASELAHLADRVGRPDQAEDWHARARKVRESGVPLVRAVALTDGEQLELDELDQPRQLRNLVLVRNRPDHPSAPPLIEILKTLVHRGDQAAVEVAAIAAKVDPYSPDPLRYLGRLHLLAGRYDKAIAAYDRALEVAPGWPACGNGRWLARELRDGRLPHLLLELLEEFAAADGKEKAEIGEALVSEFPRLACLHRQLALIYFADNEVTAAYQCLENAVARDGSDELRTQSLLLLGKRISDPDRQRRLLEEAVRINGDALAAAEASVLLRFLSEGKFDVPTCLEEF